MFYRGKAGTQRGERVPKITGLVGGQPACGLMTPSLLFSSLSLFSGTSILVVGVT